MNQNLGCSLIDWAHFLWHNNENIHVYLGRHETNRICRKISFFKMIFRETWVSVCEIRKTKNQTTARAREGRNCVHAWSSFSDWSAPSFHVIFSCDVTEPKGRVKTIFFNQGVCQLVSRLRDVLVVCVCVCTSQENAIKSMSTLSIHWKLQSIESAIFFLRVDKTHTHTASNPLITSRR